MADPVDVQKIGQENMARAMNVFGDWTKNWQAIAAEWSDYSKRSMEQGGKTIEKLMAAKTIEQAIEIQTSYARTAYDDYMREVSKIGGMYASMAKEAYKPMEQAFPFGR